MMKTPTDLTTSTNFRSWPSKQNIVSRVSPVSLINSILCLCSIMMTHILTVTTSDLQHNLV